MIIIRWIKSNKIVPADPQQNRVPIVEKSVNGGVFYLLYRLCRTVPGKSDNRSMTSWSDTGTYCIIKRVIFSA